MSFDRDVNNDIQHAINDASDWSNGVPRALDKLRDDLYYAKQSWGEDSSEYRTFKQGVANGLPPSVMDEIALAWGKKNINKFDSSGDGRLNYGEIDMGMRTSSDPLERRMLSSLRDHYEEIKHNGGTFFGHKDSISQHDLSASIDKHQEERESMSKALAARAAREQVESASRDFMTPLLETSDGNSSRSLFRIIDDLPGGSRDGRISQKDLGRYLSEYDRRDRQGDLGGNYNPENRAYVQMLKDNWNSPDVVRLRGTHTQYERGMQGHEVANQSISIDSLKAAGGLDRFDLFANFINRKENFAPPTEAATNFDAPQAAPAKAAEVKQEPKPADPEPAQEVRKDAPAEKIVAAPPVEAAAPTEEAASTKPADKVVQTLKKDEPIDWDKETAISYFRMPNQDAPVASEESVQSAKPSSELDAATVPPLDTTAKTAQNEVGKGDTQVQAVAVETPPAAPPPAEATQTEKKDLEAQNDQAAQERVSESTAHQPTEAELLAAEQERARVAFKASVDHNVDDTVDCVNDLSQGGMTASRRLSDHVYYAKQDYGNETPVYNYYSRGVANGLSDPALSDVSVGWAKRNIERYDITNDHRLNRGELDLAIRTTSDPLEREMLKSVQGQYDQLKKDGGTFPWHKDSVSERDMRKHLERTQREREEAELARLAAEQLERERAASREFMRPLVETKDGNSSRSLFKIIDDLPGGSRDNKVTQKDLGRYLDEYDRRERQGDLGGNYNPYNRAYVQSLRDGWDSAEVVRLRGSYQTYDRGQPDRVIVNRSISIESLNNAAGFPKSASPFAQFAQIEGDWQ